MGGWFGVLRKWKGYEVKCWILGFKKWKEVCFGVSKNERECVGCSVGCSLWLGLVQKNERFLGCGVPGLGC